MVISRLDQVHFIFRVFITLDLGSVGLNLRLSELITFIDFRVITS